MEKILIVLTRLFKHLYLIQTLSFPLGVQNWTCLTGRYTHITCTPKAEVRTTVTVNHKLYWTQLNYLTPWHSMWTLHPTALKEKGRNCSLKIFQRETVKLITFNYVLKILKLLFFTFLSLSLIYIWVINLLLLLLLINWQAKYGVYRPL